jgi:phenylpropionate dioxygenase-like ring-hydroxylating dioxygenase large terminal subunit
MIFNKPPTILAHKSAVANGNYVTPDYILNKNNNEVNLFHRYCPHRLYPLAKVGDIVQNIVCKFHGFEWSDEGIPINNDRKIVCGKAQIGKSGLIFKDFVEPSHQWVQDLAGETRLEFSHVRTGTSKGSWLWMMEIQADLLHIRKGEDVVHPSLAEATDLDDVAMDHGEGWILQTCSTGWWLFIYPFTFVEWSLGKIAVNYTTPNDINEEFGFSWHTQYYFNPNVTREERETFEFFVEDVFHEDVETIEQQKGGYFPLMKSISRLEEHCVHFGQWVTKNQLV